MSDRARSQGTEANAEVPAGRFRSSALRRSFLHYFDRSRSMRLFLPTDRSQCSGSRCFFRGEPGGDSRSYGWNPKTGA